MSQSETSPKGAENLRAGNPTHGITVAKRAVREWGTQALDGRTRLAKDIDRFRAAMVADLGGPEQVSEAQLTIIELAAREMILLRGLDNWMFGDPEKMELRTFNKTKKKVHPIVRDWQSLANSLTRRLVALGLDKQAPQGRDLSDWLAERAGGDDE